MDYDKSSQESPMSEEKHLATEDGKAILVDERGENVVATADGSKQSTLSSCSPRFA